MSFVPSLEASARERVVLGQLAQVRLIAMRIHQRCGKQVELEDLISAGTLGLIQAVDRFQPDRGYKLKTLAEHRIRGAILDYLRKLDPLSRTVRRFVRQREEMATRLQYQLGRLPESAELAQALHLPIERYRRLEYAANASQILSLDAMPGGAGSLLR